MLDGRRDHAVVVPVADPHDPRVADYVGLTDVALRNRVEPAGGLFVAEGLLVIQRALRAGYRLRSVFVSRRWLADLLPEVAGQPAPVYVADAAVLEAVAGFHVHRGALAAFDRRPLPPYRDLLAAACRLVVLEAATSTTNLGAVFRCAAGLGMDAVLLDPTCADPLYRRSVRVSMGEVFAVPYARAEPWPGALDEVRRAGFQLLALTPDPAATPLDALDVAGFDRVAILLGSEGPGLSTAAMAAADERVRIPMARGVDSLNVAAAAAVACWVVTRPAVG